MLEGRKNFYPSRILCSDLPTAAWSISINGHDRIGGRTHFWLVCMFITRAIFNHLIALGARPDLWPRVKRRFESRGPFVPAPISASIHHLTCGLQKIHVGFSPRLISHVVLFSMPTPIVDLHPGDLILRLGSFNQSDTREPSPEYPKDNFHRPQHKRPSISDTEIRSNGWDSLGL